MKTRLLPILLTLFFIQQAQARPALAPGEVRPLYEHLCEVNAEWLLKDITAPELWQPVAFADDTERIQAHLAMVEKRLRTSAPAGLTPAQRARRVRQLDVLRQYWQRGRFPVNTGHDHRRPYFVDDFGTACAVGYLLREDGQGAVVERVQAERNFAYVRQLPYPELVDWAAANGFTQAELAWIQPGYGPWPVYTTVGNNGGVEGKVNVMEKTTNEQYLYLAGDFTEVDGVTAAGVIAWDGDEWRTLGDGLTGEVFALEAVGTDYLIAGGDFYLPGQPEGRNLAVWSWETETWTALQEGEMGGPVRALQMTWWPNYYLYAGGDFQFVDGEPMPYLAKYPLYVSGQSGVNLAGAWNNHAEMEEGVEIQDAFTVNGPVCCLAEVDGELLVGGAFTETAPDVSEQAINSLSANYLAYWDMDEAGNWITGLYGPHPPVEKMAVQDGYLYVSGDMYQPFGLSLLQAGLWSGHSALAPDEDHFIDYYGDSVVIHNLIPTSEGVWALGAFEVFTGNNYGSGTLLFTDGLFAFPWGDFPDATRAGAEFKGHLYVTGDFTGAYNNLARLSLLTDEDEPAPPVALRVWNAAGRLYWETETFPADTDLRLFDMAGREVGRYRLSGPEGSVYAGDLPRGAYVWQAVVEGRRVAGKIVR